MKIYNYKDRQEYIDAQTKANQQKINRVWVGQKTIAEIAQRITTPSPRILCHGTRNAAEQQYFNQALRDCTVLGTEISTTAADFPFTVQWDYHEQRDEWIGSWNAVYTNSLDHSYDPQKALATWKDQLVPDGLLFIDYFKVEKIKASDPLQIDHDELLSLFEQVGLRLRETFVSHSGYNTVDRPLVYVLERIS